MASLLGQYFDIYYKDIIQISNSGSGLDGTLRSVESGSGTASALQISTSTVNINGTFSIGGNAFARSGSHSLTFTTTATTNVTLPTTGTLATLAGSETFTNKTLTSPIISTISNTGTLTLPTSTDTLVGRATTDTLTNKTFVAPVLGTPASGNLSNCTAYPIASVANLGTGVATFLATPSSANLASAITDETGTGALVFANSPTLVTPALGTPSAINLSNATSLPATALPTGTMFNFKQGQLTTSASTSSSTFTDTGITVDITPTNASNTVLVRATISAAPDTSSIGVFQLVRSSTAIGVGTSVSSRIAVGGGVTESTNNSNAIHCVTLEWLDSPATTSSTTYKVQYRKIGSGSVYLNRTVSDTDSSGFTRAASTISVCEIKV